MKLRVLAMVAVMACWAGAVRAGEDRSVVVRPLSAAVADVDLAWAATSAVHSALSAHPGVHLLSAGEVRHLAGVNVLDPRKSDRLRALGIDVLLSGRVAPGRDGLVLEAWQPGEAEPFWRATQPVTDAAALPEALRRVLPDLPAALGLAEDDRTRRFAGRAFVRTEAALRAHGAGARAYFDDADAVAALPRFQAATQADPDSTDAWTSVGWSLARQGRWDEALKPFTTAVERNPDNFDARWGLQQALDSAGRIQEAAALRDAAPAAHRDVVIDRGRRAIAAGDRAAAEAALVELRGRSGRSPLRRLDLLAQEQAAAEAFAPARRWDLLAESQAIAESLCDACGLTIGATMLRAEALRAAGRIDEAHPLEERARARLEVLSDMFPAVRADLAGRLARTLARAEDWRGVASLCFLRGSILAGMADQPTLAAAASWRQSAMALADNRLGHERLAGTAARRAYDAHVFLLGDDHVETATSALVYARILHLSAPEQAQPLFRMAAEVMARQRGADHADTAPACY